jgi:hypothetical protein
MVDVFLAWLIIRWFESEETSTNTGQVHVAKCTITTRYSLDDHESNFAPDKTVLLLRHPGSNYVSLDRKPHRDWSGSIEEKFRLLEAYFQDRGRFDAVLRYEDVVLRPDSFTETLTDTGIKVNGSHYEIPRSRLAILKFPSCNIKRECRAKSVVSGELPCSLGVGTTKVRHYLDQVRFKACLR